MRTANESLTLADIYRARRTIAPLVTRTPVVPSAALSRMTGEDVFLKLETVHPTGAFKLRGAANRILSLTQAERRCGVVTVSTGNHGRAVAYAARYAGVRAVVCMSALVPENKVQAIRELNAEVHIFGESQDEAEIAARRLVTEEGMVLVHPFDHPQIIAGQGTIGLELLEDLPELRCVITGLSGGGLLAGVALALKTASPQVRIIGVSMEQGPAMYASLKAGRPVQVKEAPSLADSLGGGIGLDNRYTFALVQRYIDDVVLVSEVQIAEAMVHLYRNERLIVEGGAAVGVAALLHGLVPRLSGPIAVIITGNTVDMETFTRIVNGE